MGAFKSKFVILAILLLFVVLYIFFTGNRPLISPDETRYIEIPREMLADHDFVTPHLNGARYFEKPVLGYWLIAGAVRVFGDNAFAGRFMPAISTGLSALIVVLLTTKMTCKRETGLYAGCVYLLMPLVFIIGTTCTLDAIFSLFVTATIVSFYCAVEDFLKKRHLNCAMWLLATGASAGCAFLVKGFLAFALPIIAVLPWLIWEKRWKAIIALPWLPFIIALAVIAPWAILIHQAQPDFWRYFVMEEHFARFFGGAKAEHPHGPFYFVLTLLWGAAEWFILSPAIGYGFGKIGIRGEKNSWFRFLICWFVGPFLFLSASSGKLPTYILPCFPAIAIMISVGLSCYFEESPEGKGKLFNIPIFIILSIGVVAIPIALVFIHHILPKHFDVILYNTDEHLKEIILFIALFLTVFLLGASIVNTINSHKFLFFMFAVISVFIASFFVMPQSIYDARSMDKFLEECRDEISPDTLIIAHGSNMHAVCLAYHRTDLYVIFPGELTYGLTCKEAEKKDRLRNQSIRKVQELLNSNPGKKVVMFFPANRYYDHYNRHGFHLPPALYIRKSINSDPENKKANGQVLVCFQ